MAKFSETRALHGKWKSLPEAAFYCAMSVNTFNSQIRPFCCERLSPVVFSVDDLDRAMQVNPIGNLPGNRVNPHQQERR
jgi:hypothetical protein